jgi:hypothetical protein
MRGSCGGEAIIDKIKQSIPNRQGDRAAANANSTVVHQVAEAAGRSQGIKEKRQTLGVYQLRKGAVPSV